MGCLGACRLPLRLRSAKRGAPYRDPNGRPSILLQAVCDANRRFLHVSAGWPGTTAEHAAFHESDLPGLLDKLPDYAQVCSAMLENVGGGWNSSVGSAWGHCSQRHWFDPPLGTFSGGGDFSLGVNMGSNSIPPKTPSDESINRGLVCAYMHFIARTQKILTFMP